MTLLSSLRPFFGVRRARILACALILSLGPKVAQAGLLDWVTQPAAEDISLPGEIRPAAKLYRPRGIHDGRARPLVVLIHGYSASAERTAAYFGFVKQVDAMDFVLLAPQGSRDSRGYSNWNATDFCCDYDRSGRDDASYVRALIHEAQTRAKIDPQRIYLVGHSNGGFLANRIACEAPGLIAAAAVLAGGTFKNASDCRAPSPLSYLQIHAIDDPTILFADQPNYAAGAETLRRRIELNGCAGEGIKGKDIDLVQPSGVDETAVTLWNHCARGTDVGLWLIPAGQGRPGGSHKPAFTSSAGPLILTWLFAHRLSIEDQPSRP